MPIRNRISGRPKPERNSLKLQSAGGQFVIAPMHIIGSTDTCVLYYDGVRVGTYQDPKEAEAAKVIIQAAIKAGTYDG